MMKQAWSWTINVADQYRLIMPVTQNISGYLISYILRKKSHVMQIVGKKTFFAWNKNMGFSRNFILREEAKKLFYFHFFVRGRLARRDNLCFMSKSSMELHSKHSEGWKFFKVAGKICDFNVSKNHACDRQHHLAKTKGSSRFSGWKGNAAWISCSLSHEQMCVIR